MTWIIGFVGVGWILAAAAGFQTGRQQQSDRQVRILEPAGSWPGKLALALYFLAMVFTTFGGAKLQNDYLGYWAVPVVLIPMFLIFVISARSQRGSLR